LKILLLWTKYVENQCYLHILSKTGRRKGRALHKARAGRGKAFPKESIVPEVVEGLAAVTVGCSAKPGLGLGVSSGLLLVERTPEGDSRLAHPASKSACHAFAGSLGFLVLTGFYAQS
jgi:hypothetical protein